MALDRLDAAHDVDEGLIYASGRDVTQRRDDERALAASESRYRALVHGLPGTAVFLVDRKLELEFAAGKSLRAGAPPPGELTGTHVRDLLPPAFGSTVADACSAALAGEERGFDMVSAEGGHRAVGSDEPAARRRRRDRRRDAHRPRRPRARRARARDR